MLTTIILSATFLTGCGEQVAPAISEYTFTGDETSAGVAEGDSVEELLSTYQDYDLHYSEDGSLYQPVTEETVFPEQGETTILLPAYYVDDEAYTALHLIKTFALPQDSFLASLKDPAFLADHKVSYAYLLFTLEKGIVTEIVSEMIDYNAEFAN